MEISSATNINAKSDASVKVVPDSLIAVGLFVIALIPRLLALTKFITADEPRWAIRSMDFLTGLLTANWPMTLQTGHPGVTTMWSGSVGLILDYLFNHQADGSLLAFVQSLPNNYQRIDPSILPWMRLPVVFLASLSVAVLYWFLRPVDKRVAAVAALLLAFHPLHLAHSQLLHHDALVSAFILFAIFLFLTAIRRSSWTLLILSGVMGGLAIISKSTAYALPPFVGLVLLSELIYQRQSLKQALSTGFLWGVVALMTAVVFWPALWVIPTQVVQTVFSFVGDAADADAVGNTLLPNFSEGFPDLGLFFYPMNWFLKTTPLMMLGLFGFIYNWRKQEKSSETRWWSTYLLLWIGLFSLLLTLGDKRDGRYLLPIYFALCILAAFGLITIYQLLITKLPLTFHLRPLNTNLYQIIFILLLPLFSLTYYPYYLTYYNPLVAGPWLAPKVIRVGWGDGMEEAAAFLNQQPNAQNLRVATIIEQSFWPYFAGQITHPDTAKTHSADYVLNYVRQIQNGVPFNEFWDYYRARPPDFTKRIAGIDYVWLHREPPLATVGRIPFGDNLTLRAFTTDSPLAVPGKPYEVTLVWRIDTPVDASARVQLRSESGEVWVESDPAPVLDPAGPSAIEGHYLLDIPPDIPRGRYRLWATVDNSEWAEFATISVGYLEAPVVIATPIEANFAHRIALRGYNLSDNSPAAGETVELTLYWQALQSMQFPFTTFIHFLDSNGNIIAQQDVQPAQGPTHSWQPQEWIADKVSLSIPPETPAGEYQLVIGWYHVETGRRLPLADDESRSSLTLGTVTVQ